MLHVYGAFSGASMCDNTQFQVVRSVELENEYLWLQQKLWKSQVKMFFSTEALK